jgi:SOS-response transcriptional repressor LexA
MNYIKHLTGFFEKIKYDNEINPSVISVYIAIFQIWNQNRFKSPINASRDEIMFASKINSTATYHKCIKILEEKGYIIYTPSFSSYTRTSIEILALDDFLKPKTKPVQIVNNIRLKNEKGTEQPLEQGREQPRERLYNIYNNKHIKTINKHSKQSNKKLFDHTSTEKKEQEYFFEYEEESKKVAQKKDKNKIVIPRLSSRAVSRDEEQIPPQWDRVFEFFIAKSSSRIEAEKFYNHYSSNGWKVGGKTAMKDWHASARNWILNTKNYNPKSAAPQPNHLHINQDKNYAEPL